LEDMSILLQTRNELQTLRDIWSQMKSLS